MNYDRLDAVAVLNIESEQTSSVNYDDIINEYAGVTIQENYK